MFDPQQALLDLLQPGGSEQTLFPPSSRYYGIAAATLVDETGRVQIHLRRRFLPPLAGGPAPLVHRVGQGERLDHLAFRYLGDPEAFWRIADANTELQAERLTDAAGRVLVIPTAAAF
jgi:hypothetical protein